MNNYLKLIYFSPTDSTKNILYKIVSGMNYNIDEEFNLTDYDNKNYENNFKENEIILLGTPVYGGRVPKIAKDRFNRIKGNNSKIILVMTYGGVHYDDSLKEFYEIMNNKGFIIIGIGIFVVKHNAIKSMGINRPNDRDYDEIKFFS